MPQSKKQKLEKLVLAKVIIGTVYHSLAVDQFVHLPLAAVGVDQQGRITFVQEVSGSAQDEKKRVLKDYQVEEKDIVVLEPSQFLCPGFIDTHIHGPQYVFTGTGYDMTLLKWLETYTFPREAAFKSLDYAKEVYGKVVRKTLRCGTTTVLLINLGLLLCNHTS